MTTEIKETTITVLVCATCITLAIIAFKGCTADYERELKEGQFLQQNGYELKLVPGKTNPVWVKTP